jgi:hypothetical protein
MAGKKNGLGDWAQFILLGFLSPELAAKKAIAMDIAPTKWQQTTIKDAQGNDVNVEVEVRPDGSMRSGNVLDEESRPLSKAELGQAASGISFGKSTKPDAGGIYEKFDANGKVIAKGRLVTEYRNNKPNTYIDLGGGKKAEFGSEWKQERISTAGAVAEQQAAVGLRYAGPLSYAKEDAANVAKFNRENGTNLGFVTPEPGAPLVDLNTGRPVTRNNDGTINAVRTPSTQGGGGAPAQGGGGGGGAPAPARQPAAAPAQAAPTQVAPRFQEPGFESETPGQFKAREKQYSDRTTKESQIAGEDIATVRKNQGKSEDNADYLLTKTTELVNHPGFETSVGAQGASYLFGALDTPLLPQLGGGPARDWAARFKEIQGQQFLQAIETMRGTGSISEAEGKAAQAAIARMSQSQTETEFKTAVKDFQDIIKRGVDRTRSKLGQEPKYGTAPASQTQSIPGAAPGAPASSIKIIKRERI